MSLLDTIKSDQLEARKSRDNVISNLLGVVAAACDTKSKQGKVARNLTDAEVLAIVQSTLKQLGETLKLLEGSDRAEDIAKLTREQQKLLTYLPKQLTTEEVTDIAIRQHSLGLNLGQIMGFLKANYAGRYDAREASEIVKGVVLPE